MKKLLLIVGLVMMPFVLCTGGCVFTFVQLNRANDATQRSFYRQVAGGDAKAMIESFAPELQADIDEPVLQAWLDRVNQELGAFEGIGYEFSVNMTDDQTEYKAVANFAKGSVDSLLIYKNEKLAGFLIESNVLDGAWAKGQVDPSMYKERTIKLFEEFTTGDLEYAYGLFHEKFQETVSLEEFKAIQDSFTNYYGTVSSIQFDSHEFSVDSEGQVELRVKVLIEAKNGNSMGMVRYDLVGMKFVLLEFQFNSQPKEHLAAEKN